LSLSKSGSELRSGRSNFVIHLILILNDEL
jgi:hypothetical protein